MARPRLDLGGAEVEVTDLGKSYGRTRVLDGVGFHAPAGSFTTFLGPSGSGKTTTLSIITGLVAPDAGHVRIGGSDCTRVPVNKRDLGFVFQSYALFPHMTVERNIAFPLTLRKLGKAEIKERVGAALELVKLEGLAKRYPTQLSGGQQQRVALARAVVYRPRVLLMDEPLGALDAGLRAHLQREIVRIGRELGATILYVTHDQDEALSMSDRIVLFNRGRIEQIGDPHDLYARPATAFAATFVGKGCLVRGRAETDRDRWVVRSETGLTVPVEASSLHGLREGTALGAMIRPESVSLAALHEPAPADAHLVGSGTVIDLVYTGDQQQVRVALADGTEVEFRCDPADAPSWPRGTEVDLWVSLRRLPFAVPLEDPPAPAGSIASADELVPA